MDGGQALFAFWAGADEPQTREGRVGGLWREVHRFLWPTDTNERIWADGHLTPRAILLFWTQFRAPRAVDACSTGARGAIRAHPLEAGAAIYCNKRAEGAPYAHPPAPAGGRGLPHPLRGAGTGTDRPRAGPRQLAARAYGLMSSSIADWGQKGQREAQNSQD